MIAERCWQIMLSPPCYVLKCLPARWLGATESADSGVTNNHLFRGVMGHPSHHSVYKYYKYISVKWLLLVARGKLYVTFLLQGQINHL